MDMPSFGRWARWTDCYGIPDCGWPGVYLLARFEGRVPRKVEPLSSDVIYMGETCSSLENRWWQFANSAFKRKSGHSGGWTFSSCYCEDQVADPPAWLYISALPVTIEEPHRSAYIRYVERWLLWEYVQKHGRLPACNRK